MSIPEKEGNITIHLKDPLFENNILKTDKGGVIEGEDFRIQAEHIVYNKTEETIEARGDLMLIYNGRIFLGESLHYDIKKEEGEVIKGKTYDNLWIVGGDKILLKSDRSVVVLNAFLTASEREIPSYDIVAKELKIENKNIATAKRVQFRFKRIPVLYLPKLTANLDGSASSPIQYSVTWDKAQGAKLSMRYRFFSSESTDLFARLDLRTSRGFGGAIESDYKSLYHNISGKTKSYLAHDTFWNDDNPNKKKTRWRLQGYYDLSSSDQKTNAHFQYDWISDRNMPLDFKGDSFELNPSQRTEAIVTHRDNLAIYDLYVCPNINKFQGFKQQLPTFKTNFRPLEFGASKILMENAVEASFLDYEYATDLGAPIPSFHSIKLDSTQNFYRSFPILHCNITPSAGFENILYSNTQKNQTILTTLLTYGAKVDTSFSKNYASLSHIVHPYLHFEALRPMNFKEHYIFDLTDGYAHFQQLKVGALNEFYSYKDFGPPRMALDLYALRFIGTRELSQGFSKLSGHLELNFPRLCFYTDVIYNIKESLYDRCNFGTKWTLNRYFAVSLDYFHRSRFDYRKDDPLNYILDATVPASVLLATPISVQRNLFCAKFELTFPPNWTLRFESHTGWARKNQPPYSEFKVHLLHTIASHWSLRLTYERFTNNDGFSFGLSLISF